MKNSVYDLRAFVELSVACLTYVLRCAPTFHKLERHYPTVETIMQEFYDIIKLPFALKMLDKHLKLAMATYPMMRLCSQEKN